MERELDVRLILKKEELDEGRVDETNVAVVLDVLLATTTIAACLEAGAAEVIPCMDGEDARGRSAGTENGCLAGEYMGKTIDGFLDPLPGQLSEQVEGRPVFLATTNGTVAIKKASDAKKVWMASLLNGRAVAEKVFAEYEGETILVICSGSGGGFSLEDFFGAGLFISELLRLAGNGGQNLPDSAAGAVLFYEAYRGNAEKVFSRSAVGKGMAGIGLQDELRFAAREGVLAAAPYLSDGKVII
ncbi:2-phosphosulfolactate phosphatase [Bhargavaea cecembensis]|uniref:2-phosphosulfolactate phosphatase n=1 Tax=Bhargavaea cecembensis TaxID=394098 RepID=UPI00058D0C00|nr:2-phosphosulfolactate phosphatase [Bhargavaea cecembensis]